MLKSILLSYCRHWNLHSLMNGMGKHKPKQKRIRHWWCLLCIINLYSNRRWWWLYDNRTKIGVNELFPLLPSIGIAKFSWTKQVTCHQFLHSLFLGAEKKDVLLHLYSSMPTEGEAGDMMTNGFMHPWHLLWVPSLLGPSMKIESNIDANRHQRQWH